MSRKQDTTATITGLAITEQRQQQVGQALLLALAKQEVDMDGVAITFTTEEF